MSLLTLLTLLYPERWNSWRAGVFILWSCSLESTPPTSTQHIKLCYF